MKSFDDLKLHLREFAKARNWLDAHNPKNLVMALSVECSELVEHFQWLDNEQSRILSDQKRKQISFEIADIQMYLIRIADELNIDLEQAITEKTRINEHRFPINP